MSGLDPITNTLIGAIAGVLEVTVNQPLIFFKNALQTKMAIPKNPLTWYRGYAVNAGSLAPITAIQVAASGLYYDLLFAPKVSPTTSSSAAVSAAATASPSLFANATSAMLAGMTSGLVSGPAESVILQQQFTGANAVDTLKRMAAEAGARSVYRGTSYAMFRDGVFTAGFMALGPFLSRSFRPLFAAKSGKPAAGADGPVTVSAAGELAARLLGGSTAGVVAAVATHPADTIKTRYQSDFRATKYSSLAQVRMSNASVTLFVCS